MYEAVHVRPDGDDLRSMVETAERFGYDGIVVRNHGDSPPDADLDEVRATSDIDVVSGVEIVADDRSTAGGHLGSHRSDRTVVCVHGGDPVLNRFAVDTERVDVLAHPLADGGDVDHVLAERAAEHDVALELDLSAVLRATDGRRVRAIAKLRRLWRLIEHADAPFVVSADPRSRYHLRAPRELQAVGASIGIDAEAIETGLHRWGEIAARNRARLDDAQVEPGVRRQTEGTGQ